MLEPCLESCWSPVRLGWSLGVLPHVSPRRRYGWYPQSPDVEFASPVPLKLPSRHSSHSRHSSGSTLALSPGNFPETSPGAKWLAFQAGNFGEL